MRTSTTFTSNSLALGCHLSLLRLSLELCCDHHKHTIMKEARFPGDPRFSGWISPSSEDTSVLSTNAWLSTLLLDCILQRSVPPQEFISTNVSHIGSLGTYEYFKSCNDLINDNPEVVEDETTKGRKLARSRNVARIRQQMKACFGSPRTLNRLLIPIVLGDHFFVLCLDCSISTPEFINDMTFYDSLVRRTRQVNPDVLRIVKVVNFFIHNFLLHEKKHAHLRDSDAALIGRVHYCDCPMQKNGFDCGLFAVGVVLHLIEGIDVTRETFRQQDVTTLRSRLVTVFGGMVLTWEQQVRLCVIAFLSCAEVAS